MYNITGAGRSLLGRNPGRSGGVSFSPALPQAPRSHQPRRVRALGQPREAALLGEPGLDDRGGGGRHHPPASSASSIALIGFGLDSVIEGFASLVIVWRFTGAPDVLQRRRGPRAEARGPPVLRAGALRRLRVPPTPPRRATRPEESWVGIGLAASSVVADADARHRQAAHRRPDRVLGHQGRRAAKTCSVPTWPERCSSGCWATSLAGAWWLDSTVGLLIAGLAVKEGVEAWRGEGCCVSDPLGGAHPFGDDCCTHR